MIISKHFYLLKLFIFQGFDSEHSDSKAENVFLSGVQRSQNRVQKVKVKDITTNLYEKVFFNISALYSPDGDV